MSEESITAGHVSQAITDIENLIRREEYAKAIEAISALDLANLPSAEAILAYHFYGVALFRLGRVPESLAKFKKSLEVSTAADDKIGQARAYEQIGGLYHNANNFKEAESNYRQALIIWRGLNDLEGQGRGHRNLGNVLVDLNNSSEALKEYDRSRDLFRQANKPEEMAPAIIHKASVLYQNKGIQEALAAYKDGIETDNCRHYLVLNNYGFLLMLNGDVPEGQAIIEEALASVQNDAIDPDDLGLMYLNIGVGYSLQRQLDKGEEFLRKASVIMEGTPEVRAVEFLLQANDKYHAQGFLPYLVVDNGSKNSLVHLNLATMLVWAGRLEEAKDEAEKGIEIDRDASYPYLSAGWVYLAAGDEKKAAQYFRRALGAEPSNEHYKNALELVNPYLTANVGRNDPCPCGSGKKFKKCHGAAI